MDRKRRKRAGNAVDARPDSDRTASELGVVSFAEGDELRIDCAMECENCGTFVEFLTDRCPICGRRFDVAHTGLASIFFDMDFETDRADEIHCPVCGVEVRPQRGRCPECKEPIGFTGKDDPGTKVDPIVHDDNVVFVHLDVEAGEVDFLQRIENGSGFEHLSVRLETIGQGGFDHARRSASGV